MTNDSIPDYELYDCGGGRRLERFGKTIVNRPCVAAFWPRFGEIDEWKDLDAYYRRNEDEPGKWVKEAKFPTPWQIKIDKITIELRPSSNSQVGIFPEQLPNWRWMTEKIKEAKRPLKILNLFAYTGVATLMASAAAKEVEVCHVDGAKSAVNWARRNAELSDLSENHIRWIVDDVMKFVEREIKRGKKYDGIILDPPAFGRGPGGSWKLERDLPKLMDLIAQILVDDPCFVILSCHALEVSTEDLQFELNRLPNFKEKNAEAINLTIPASKGNELPASICGRISG